MKQYPTPSQGAPQGPSSPQQTPPRSARRRRLLQAGLSTAPALLALKASPVRADNCKSPSGFSVSGNLSRNKGSGCTMGHNAVFWSTNLNSNGSYRGSGQIMPTTLFSDRFPPLGNYPDGSFDEMLKGQKTADQALFAAVFLESHLHSGDGFPTRDMIKDMWRAVVNNGLYPVPNTGISWDKPAILKYLLYLTGQAPG